ncbi:MAG: transposase [Marinifilaceae bacterium]
MKDLSEVGFDETSRKNGHIYVTTLVDLETRRVLYVTKRKDAETINNSVEYLKDKSVDVEGIKQVCIDMSPSFISGCKAHKYTFLKNKISQELYDKRNELMDLHPKLGEGFRLVRLFKEFWDINYKDD